MPRVLPTLFLFRNQSVTYPRRRPSIRLLIRRIEALGYKVFCLPQDIRWGDIPQEDWSIVVKIFFGNSDDSRQLCSSYPFLVVVAA